MSSAISSEGVLALVWTPCPTCWGQRRVFVDAGAGEGYEPVSCTPCLGVGEVLTGAP